MIYIKELFYLNNKIIVKCIQFNVYTKKNTVYTKKNNVRRQ